MKARDPFAGRLILVVAIVAALGFCWAKWGGRVNRRIAETFKSDSSRVEEAAAAYEARDWERAAALTRPVLKSGADDVLALRIYARASARMEHDVAAATIYARRLASTQLEPEDFFVLGLLNARANQFERALDFWTKADREGYSSPELLDNLARLSASMQRLDEAADAARRLSRMPGSEARGLLLLGEILALLDDPKGSALALRDALARDPKSSDAPLPLSHYRKRLARGLLQLGQPAEARVALLESFKGESAGSPDAEAHWLLSRAWLGERNFKEAAAALLLAGSYRSENPLIPEPGPYVGEASCVSCHRDLARAHEKSRHARTFHHGPGLLELPLPDRPLADPDDPKVMHTFEREKDQIKVHTRSGDKAFDLVVEYAFGISDQYVTMVGRDTEGTYRAPRLSSYHTAGGSAWGRTSGDVPSSNSAENIRGEPIRVRDGVVRCLYCHVTVYRDFRDPPPEPGRSAAAADKAIGCERCHGPGANHLKAINANIEDPAIVNPRAGGASAIAKLCADCHIVGSEGEIRNEPENPRFVRSPGLTLTFSRCYNESAGAMSCMTCHDAHRDDQGPPSSYEAKCLSCHASRSPDEKLLATKPKDSSPSQAKMFSVCPVNATSKCLECHMPKIPVTDLHRDLTDHYIRVHDRNKK